MVYRYKCKYCGMVHNVSMTEEQQAVVVKSPYKVHDILPRLMGCYKAMIHHGTCPSCEREGTVRPA